MMVIMMIISVNQIYFAASTFRGSEKSLSITIELERTLGEDGEETADLQKAVVSTREGKISVYSGVGVDVCGCFCCPPLPSAVCAWHSRSTSYTLLPATTGNVAAAVTDFTSLTDHCVEFAANSLTVEFTIILTDDDVSEVEEYLYIYITNGTASSNVAIGQPSEARVIIEDDGKRRILVTFLF